MRDYSKFSSTFWIRGTGKSLRGNHLAQAIASYLFTAPTANMIGLYYLPVQTIAHDVGCPLEGALEVLRDLVARGFCEYDEDAEMVFVKTMAPRQLGLDTDKVMSPRDKRHPAVLKMLKDCSEPLLLQAFWRQHREQLALPDPWWEAPSKPHRSQEQEQEQEQELNDPSDRCAAEAPSKPHRSQEQEQEQENDPSDRCAAAPAGPESFGLTVPEETAPTRKRRPKQIKLPDPVPSFGEVMQLWRERYRTSSVNPTYGRYTESGADIAAVKVLISDAVSVVDDEVRTRRQEPASGRCAAVLHVLDHWMRAFLADQKPKLVEECHPLSWLRNGRTKYGDPWSKKHRRKVTQEEVQAAKADPFVARPARNRDAERPDRDAQDPRATFEAALGKAMDAKEIR